MQLFQEDFLEKVLSINAIARRILRRSTIFLIMKIFSRKCFLFSTSSLADSTSSPYFTPAGHAVWHAWQSRQKYISSMNASETGNEPSMTLFINRILPRGEFFSSPVNATSGKLEGKVRNACTVSEDRLKFLFSKISLGRIIHLADDLLDLLPAFWHSSLATRFDRNNLPGFRTRFGSIILLVCFIILIKGVSYNSSKNFFFASPTPCSPVIVPPRSTAFLNISSNVFSILRISFFVAFVGKSRRVQIAITRVTESSHLNIILFRRIVYEFNHS